MLTGALGQTPGATSGGVPQLQPFVVTGDRIDAPLGGATGDAARGRALVLDRSVGNCLICHAVPETGERFMGDLAPSLAGVGRTLSVSQLRLRLVDQRLINPATIMPSYYRVNGLTRVAPLFRGKPVLSGQEIEDVIAYLMTLR